MNNGVVKFFNDTKGFWFCKGHKNGQRVLCSRIRSY
jgi:cold shock CspA family protein